MKKILLAVLLFVTVGAIAQSTTPRFGTTAGRDNTYRLLTNGYVTLTDAAGADSSALTPKYFNNIYRIVLVDSFTLKQPVVTSSFAGDQITIIISAASGTPFLKFTGSNWITAGTATMTTRLRSVIKLVFDGAKWVETGRYTQ